ncbi:hypothetical protein IFM89_029206 [Coptis chinensis]|uniref:Protein kinase domain-containing protein n=1 Tax=Coptis chinensis TaxID=261450 RepID=A0A835MFL6_9MAGN|nr:hypothetical protein IFM89_029206 [Coptis chinensis]
MFRSGSPFRSRSPAYQRKRSLSRDDEVVIHKMKVPVILLNVTRLTNFRKDGHPSIYGKNVTDGRKVSTRQHDYSHWCVPGVPDAWNELIYNKLFEYSVDSRYVVQYYVAYVSDVQIYSDLIKLPELRAGDGQSLQGTVGSPFYIAPEVLAGGYNQAGDVWSAGVILYILLSGMPPFWGKTKLRIFNSVRAANLQFPSDSWDHISASAKDLITGMLCTDPAQRLTASKVLENSEPVQIMHYVHEDTRERLDYYGDIARLGFDKSLMATVVLYLSNVSHGGKTFFRKSESTNSQPKEDTWSECARTGYAVKPLKGNALLFFNVQPNTAPDENSSNARCPVLQGNTLLCPPLLPNKPFGFSFFIDTLGERLYEGCDQAYILKFDRETTICRLPSETQLLEGKTGADQKTVAVAEGRNGQVQQTNNLKETPVTKQPVAKPEELGKMEGEEEVDIKKGLMDSTPLHHRLQIEFHYTEFLQPTPEPQAVEAAGAMLAVVPVVEAC